MKKITKKTRIKIHRSISKEFNIGYCDFTYLRYYMEINFGLIFTSKRYSFDYYKPTSEQKLMLFLIQYSNYIRSK